MLPRWSAQAFDNAISWVETAMENFDALGQIVKDVAEALEITDLRDFDRALATLLKPKDLAERDNRIRDSRRIKRSSMLGSPGRKPSGPRPTRRWVRPSTYSPNFSLMCASQEMS